MNSNQNYPNPRMDLIPLLMENQSPKDPATKTILKIVKIVTQKRFFFKSCQEKFLNDRPDSKKFKYKEKSQRTFLYTPPPLPWLRNSLEEPTPELTPKFDKTPNMEQAYMTISYP